MHDITLLACLASLYASAFTVNFSSDGSSQFMAILVS